MLLKLSLTLIQMLLVLYLPNYLVRVKSLLNPCQESSIELSNIFLVTNFNRVSVIVNQRLENACGIGILLI